MLTDNLKTTPRAHQERGYELITTRPANLLAWEMGTGKTFAALLGAANVGARRILILCPRPVLRVWQIQIQRHFAEPPIQLIAPIRGTITDRAAETRRFFALCGDAPAGLICNYEAIWRGAFATLAAEVQWDLLICDEIHRLKAPGGKASRWIGKLAKRIPRRLGLTGTPMPHSPLDIYAQFRVLAPSIFGSSFQAFKFHYARWGGFRPPGAQHGVEVVEWINQEELQERFYRVADRVETKDVMELPDLIEDEITVQLPPKIMATYRELRDTLVAELQDEQQRSGIITVSNALTKVLRLQQLTSGLAHWEDIDDPTRTKLVRVHNEKADALRELLLDLPESEPVVVFCRFHADLDAVHEAAAACDRTSVELSGRRHDIEGEWGETKATVAAVQIQAGAEGISLTRACRCVFYSVHSLGNYLQARARVYRDGQTRKVFLYHLVADGTIDRAIYKAFQQRKEIIDVVMDRVNNSYEVPW